MADLRDILAPLLGGLAASTSRPAAVGVNTALDIGIANQVAKRRREAEAARAQRTANVAKALSNLPSDPDAPEYEAIRAIAPLDPETALSMYPEAVRAKIRRATERAEEEVQQGKIAALTEAAQPEQLAGEVGPPTPEPIRRGRVIKALAQLSPAQAAQYALQGEEPRAVKQPQLVHRMGDQGEGLYRWENGAWVYDSPVPKAERAPRAPHLVETGEPGKPRRVWVSEGEEPPPHYVAPQRPAAEEDPAALYNRLSTARQAAMIRLEASRRKDQADLEAQRSKAGVVKRALGKAPTEVVKSPTTLQIEQEVAAIDAALAGAAAKLQGGGAPVAAPPPPLAAVPAHRTGPQPRTWEEFRRLKAGGG